ncbi:MAG: TIGR03013 family PEP-CTERM/XrtA system glycosyltransferase [Gammaproteobacteria bacterium]|nr:TIGR03013 family PEP-CTERM/XrtA system glycosyltransferase [Gammaproteobacteria bacterium]
MAHIRIAKHYVHVPYLLLGTLDFFCLMAALYLAAFFRFFGQLTLFMDAGLAILPSAAVFGFVNLLVMMALGVHPSKMEEGLAGMMIRTILAVIISVPVLALAYFVASDWLWYLGGDGILASASVFGLFLMGAARSLFFAIAGDQAFQRRVLVLGAGTRAEQLNEGFDTPFARKGFTIIGFVPVEEEVVRVPEALLINPVEGLPEYVRKHPVDEIVVAVDDRRRNIQVDELLECKMRGIPIIDAPAFYERESRKVALEMISKSWLVFADGYNGASVHGIGKRAIDLFTSLALLAAAWPVMLLTMLAIKLEDGWKSPVFYLQERVGLNGIPFKVIKFRSMRTDAEKHGAMWATKNDSRVTRVGDFIRKVRIDELPQILNVLKGDMSFVGPRPERPVFVEKLAQSIPLYNERHRVKPGITGWAQMCFAYADSEEDTREKLRYDLYYIKNQSLLLDLLIIIQTVEVVLFKKGSR